MWYVIILEEIQFLNNGGMVKVLTNIIILYSFHKTCIVVELIIKTHCNNIFLSILCSILASENIFPKFL